jgi:multidrug efflux pump subunit AcrB
VTEKLDQLKGSLPHDLVVARTSDQPLQVEESIDLFMEALYEAILLVVLIALVGFWEWRSALLMAISMPITLAMTFGMAHLVGVDLQQVSIATLIIALGLLVDDPVVANDAIKNELAAGLPRLHASWVGPTKLARAILYATATNIIAYLPFLMLEGSTGDFLRTLPIVMTAALVASRIASMTFIPLLGYYLLKPSKKPEPSIEERRQSGFYGFYYRVSGLAIRYRWGVLALSIVFLAIGGLAATRLKSQFFPEDVQYWSYVDVWLPNNAPLALTNELAQRAEQVIRRVTEDYDKTHGTAPHLLKGITTFAGGGGPRFWFSVSPEQQQLNYAQILIQVTNKEVTPELVKPLQTALSREIAGAFLIVHQLQTNPVEVPVEVRISAVADIDPKDEAVDNQNLRRLAGQLRDLLLPVPGMQVVQDDWFAESPEVRLEIDADRANLAGITNRDVASSTAAAISGTTVTSLREGNQQIPVIARLLPQDRAQLSDIENLYVYSSSGQQKVPLRSVSRIRNELETERIRRQEHFRMIRVNAYPQPGVLPSELLARAMPKLNEFERNLPAGYRMELGGERAKQQSGFLNLTKVLAISLAGIYAALLLQFNNAVKPLLVFAATPYGVVGALLALAITGTPFGFMAFLGVASLIGVIISHVIVLFDFIEEMHEKGEPLEQAVRDAGIHRLRPVLITVGATILALFPLASHGGPLWQPLCYAQIGGLAVATFITLLLVPVLYSIAVLDLKIVKW